MRYRLLLTRAFFIPITVFSTVTVISADCTPTGTWQRDVTDSACAALETKTLNKTSYWNITWPDGFVGSLNPSGTGQCTFRAECNPATTNGTTDCWPDFYPPVKTSSGGFSILVVNKVTERVRKDCAVPPFQWDQVFCNNSGERTWEPDSPHNCLPPPNECSGINCELVEQELDPPDCCPSPILIDTTGNGFSLTHVTGGVRFDLNRDGYAEQLAWTSTGSDEAWLCLDRNGNGTIDNGEELFGNYTPQPEPPPDEKRNGFLALAEYDKPINGGNSDGKINENDAVFASLRLWRDTSHNGISEPAELYTLPALGLKTLHLDYQAKKKADEWGNGFRYRAKVTDNHDAQLGRWAWDVFLVSAP